MIRKSVRRLLAASCTNCCDHKTSHKTLVAPHPQIIFSGTSAYSTEPLNVSVLRVENSGTNTQIIEWCKGFLDCFEKMEQWQKLIRIRSVLGWPIGFVFTLLVKVCPFFFADQIRPALTCHNASFNAPSKRTEKATKGDRLYYWFPFEKTQWCLRYTKGTTEQAGGLIDMVTNCCAYDRWYQDQILDQKLVLQVQVCRQQIQDNALMMINGFFKLISFRNGNRWK